MCRPRPVILIHPPLFLSTYSLQGAGPARLRDGIKTRWIDLRDGDSVDISRLFYHRKKEKLKSAGSIGASPATAQAEAFSIHLCRSLTYNPTSVDKQEQGPGKKPC
jgi:hypothetical protein